MQNYEWYQNLIKPSWAPPSWIFGPVWSFLYIVIAVTFVYVFYQIFTKKIPKKVGVPFVLNLVFNLAFTPIQFGLKDNLLAFLDIILVLATLLWSFVSIWRYKKLIVFANIPYILWVAFATILQATITWLNLLIID